MLAACAPHARWVDVFCERRRVRRRPGPRGPDRRDRAPGCCLRVHANQLGPGPGVQLAVELGAASADHCTHLTDADVDALRRSATVATLLPGRRVLHPLAVPGRPPAARRRRRPSRWPPTATPARRYTSSMPFCIALAVREMRMTPAEALWAATAGGARALRRDRRRPARASARAPTSPCSTPRPTSTWPTGRACRSPAPSTCRASARPPHRRRSLTITTITAARSGFGSVGLSLSARNGGALCTHDVAHCRLVRRGSELPGPGGLQRANGAAARGHDRRRRTCPTAA